MCLLFLFFFPDSPWCEIFFCALDRYTISAPLYRFCSLIVGIAFIAVPAELISSYGEFPAKYECKWWDAGSLPGGTNRAQTTITVVNKTLREEFYRGGGAKLAKFLNGMIDTVTRGGKYKRLSAMVKRLQVLSDDELNFVLAGINVPMMFQLCYIRHPLIQMFTSGADGRFLDDNYKFGGGEKIATSGFDSPKQEIEMLRINTPADDNNGSNGDRYSERSQKYRQRFTDSTFNNSATFLIALGETKDTESRAVLIEKQYPFTMPFIQILYFESISRNLWVTRLDYHRKACLRALFPSRSGDNT